MAGVGRSGGVVAQDPPAVAVPAYRALDRQLAGSLRPVDEHHGSGPWPGSHADEDHVAIRQGWRHRRPTHHHAPPRPPDQVVPHQMITIQDAGRAARE